MEFTRFELRLKLFVLCFLRTFRPGGCYRLDSGQRQGPVRSGCRRSSDYRRQHEHELSPERSHGHYR